MATFTKIATIQVGAGGASSVAFTSIPQNFTNLKLVFSFRLASSGNVGGAIRINGTNGSSPLVMYGNNTGTQSEVNNLTGWANSSSYAANTFSNGTLYVLNYTASANKTYSFDSITETNGNVAYLGLASGAVANTSPTTSIELYNGDTLAQYSLATLYGI